MAVRRSTLRGPQAQTATQKRIAAEQRAEGTASRLTAQKTAAATAAQKRGIAADTARDTAAGNVARDVAVTRLGVVPEKRGPAKTKRQQFQASKKSRQNQLAKLRAFQAQEEAKKIKSIRDEKTPARSNTFRGGAPIVVGKEEFRITDDPKKATERLRRTSTASRQDFDITTGRQALERLSGQREKLAEGRKEVQFRRGIGSPSANRRASLLNVEGMKGFQSAMADINRARNALADRSAQQATGQAPAPAPVPAPQVPSGFGQGVGQQVGAQAPLPPQPPIASPVPQPPTGPPQTDAGGFPLPPVQPQPVPQPGIPPVGPQPTQGSVPTSSPQSFLPQPVPFPAPDPQNIPPQTSGPQNFLPQPVPFPSAQPQAPQPLGGIPGIQPIGVAPAGPPQAPTPIGVQPAGQAPQIQPLGQTPQPQPIPQAPLDPNQINQMLSNPNIQSLIPTMPPAQQQQLISALEQRLGASRGLQAPPPPPAPPAFGRTLDFGERELSFLPKPGQPELQRPDLTIRGPETGQGQFGGLTPDARIREKEADARIAQTQRTDALREREVSAAESAQKSVTGETVTGTAANTEADKGRALEMGVGSALGLGDPFEKIDTAERDMNALLNNTALKGAERVEVAKAIRSSKMYLKAQSIINEAAAIEGAGFLEKTALATKFLAVHGFRAFSDEGKKVLEAMTRIKGRVDSEVNTPVQPTRPVPGIRG